MNRWNDSRLLRTSAVVVVTTIATIGSFGSAAHADGEPVADPPVETGETGGAVVAVAAPPVPTPPVVVAVGPPPVPVPPVVVAVGQPPVPNPPRAQPATPAVPRVQPATPAAPQVRSKRVDAPPAVTGLRRVPSVDERLTDVLAAVFTKLAAARSLATVARF